MKWCASMSTPESIELDALQAYLAGIEGQLPAGAQVEVSIGKSRLAGLSTDYAKGLITAQLASPFGFLVITSGWEAFPQARPEDGWCILPLADAAGEGVEAATPVLDDGEPCPASGESLRQLAWDFWSMLDLNEAVVPQLDVAR